MRIASMNLTKEVNLRAANDFSCAREKSSSESPRLPYTPKVP